uniref:Uncharacterized protein n=1 Tax=Anopheles atroparvus TaxID=41427 RepID=A0A182ITT1_ANOAO
MFSSEDLPAPDGPMMAAFLVTSTTFFTVSTNTPANCSNQPPTFSAASPPNGDGDACRLERLCPSILATVERGSRSCDSSDSLSSLSGERLRLAAGATVAVSTSGAGAGSSPKLFTFDTELTLTMFTFVPKGVCGSRLATCATFRMSSDLLRRTRSSSFSVAPSLAASPKPMKGKEQEEPPSVPFPCAVRTPDEMDSVDNAIVAFVVVVVVVVGASSEH